MGGEAVVDTGCWMCDNRMRGEAVVEDEMLAPGSWCLHTGNEFVRSCSFLHRPPVFAHTQRMLMRMSMCCVFGGFRWLCVYVHMRTTQVGKWTPHE